MADAGAEADPTSAPMEEDAAPAPAPAEAPAEPAAPVHVTPDAVKKAEQAALNVNAKINMQAAPVRTYLESTVVPTVMAGLQAVVKERPENPVEYLAYYLLTHNPMKPSKPFKMVPPKDASAADAPPTASAHEPPAAAAM